MLANKKGYSLTTLSGVAFTAVMVTLALTMGVYILSEVGQTGFPTETLNQTVVFADNATWYALPYRAASVSSMGNSTHVINLAANEPGATNNLEANFSYRDADPTTEVLMYGNETHVIGSYNVTYQAYNSDAYMANQNATVGVATVAEWMPIIGLVLAAAAVIGILMMAFAGKRGF